MAEDRDIRARLEIEKTGDKEAFKEVAQDLDAIKEPAKGLGHDLEQLGQQLDDLFEGRPDSAGAFEEALAGVQDELDAILHAEGPEQQKEKIEALAPAAEEVRETLEGVTEALDDVGASNGPADQAEDLQSVASASEAAASGLDRVGDGVDRISSAAADSRLEESFARAKEAWQALASEIDSGGEQVGQRLVDLRIEIERLKSEISIGKFIGDDVTRAEQALAGLEEAYDGVARSGRNAGGEAKKAGQEGKAAAEGQVRPIRNLNDLLEAGLGRWAKWAAGATAAFAALKAGWEIGTKLRDVLNEISDGGFDDYVQGTFTEAMEQVGFTISEVEGAASRLNNNLKILAAEGIDVTGKSVLEIDQLVQQLGRTMSERSQQASAEAEATKQQAAAHEEWAAGLRLSKTALDEESAALAANIERFAAANEGILSAADLREIFGDQIQGILDDYARLGKEPEEHIQRLAAAWGILSTAQEKAAESSRRVVEQIRSDVLGAARATAEEVQALAAAIPAALEGIDFRSLVDPEAAEQARQAIAGLLETLRAAGQQIPAELAAAATELGLFIAQTEALPGVTTSVAAGVDELVGKTVKLVTTTDEAGNTIQKLVQTAETAVPGIAGFTDAITTDEQAMQQALDTWGEGGDRLQGLAAAADSATAATERSGEAAAAAAEGSQTLASATEDQATATEHASQASSDLAADARAVGDAATEQAEGTERAAASLESMADSVERLQQLQANTDLSKLLGDTKGVDQDLQAIQTRVDGVATALNALGTAAPAALAPLRRELAAVRADAEATGAALRAALSPGGAATPIGPLSAPGGA